MRIYPCPKCRTVLTYKPNLLCIRCRRRKAYKPPTGRSFNQKRMKLYNEGATKAEIELVDKAEIAWRLKMREKRSRAQLRGKIHRMQEPLNDQIMKIAARMYTARSDYLKHPHRVGGSELVAYFEVYVDILKTIRRRMDMDVKTLTPVGERTQWQDWSNNNDRASVMMKWDYIPESKQRRIISAPWNEPLFTGQNILRR